MTTLQIRCRTDCTVSCWVSLPASPSYGILVGEMEPITHFTPGEFGGDGGTVRRLRWPIPPGVSEPYVEAYTKAGDAVLIPYCQGAPAVREVAASGRKALALNFDPLIMLVVETELTAPPERDLNSAVARLGDSLKQGMPLRRYLADLYVSSCPACSRSASVDYFVWDRERAAPVAKQLTCPGCKWDGRAAVEPEDLERLAEVQPKGMHYHFVLERARHPTDRFAFLARLESMLALYSPRNLYALAELTLKIESYFPEGPLHGALKTALLDCLDLCSSLTPLPGSKARRRGLARPSRFMEKNVWSAFEEAVGRLRGSPGQSLGDLADSLEQFQSAEENYAGFVGPGLVRDLSRSIPPRSIQLILFSAPPLSSAAWSLSYLWGAWLLGAEAASPLHPLLRQRTPDPTWYARVMSGSLRALGGLLRDDGRMVIILSEQRPIVVEALVSAASRARLGLSSLVQCGADYRLELAPTFLHTARDLVQADTDTPPGIEAQIRLVTREVAIDTIRQRGEPISWRTLHATLQVQLAQVGLIADALEDEDHGPEAMGLVAESIRDALDDPAFASFPSSEGSDELWWLAGSPQTAVPLSDRVEDAAFELLQGTLALRESDFSRAIYLRFPAFLSPEADLVAACLRSYGQETSPGYWQLRREDLPSVRDPERQDMIERLVELGWKLGYRSGPHSSCDVAWFEGDQLRAAFVVRWKAAISEILDLNAGLPGPGPVVPPADESALPSGGSSLQRGTTPFLVIPGGRSALAGYKLAHNPLWQHAVNQVGWRFIKYQHVRQLLDQPDVDVYALQTIVGLDPIVERDGAQLPLF